MPRKQRAPKLNQTQRWLQAVIRQPGPVEAAVRSPRAQKEIARQAMPVTPSPTLTALERVDVYREMYWLRLREALSIDYPELKAFLGDDAFDALCDAYVKRNPSRTYTLNRLGDHLPRFIARGGGKLARKEFLADLARLELLMTEVFDEEEVPVLDEQQVKRVPPEAWERIRLQAIPALRMAEFRYPVSAYVSATRDESPKQPLLRRRNSWVIVFRRNYSVHRMELPKSAFQLFAALAKGKPLGQAVASAKLSPEELRDWFATWVANRVFRAPA